MLDSAAKMIASDPFVDRVRGFLIYLRPHLVLTESDAEKIMKLRRIADIRIRQAKVQRPRLSPTDLCRLISPDSSRTPFSSTALSTGLLGREQLATLFEPLSESMAVFLEGALLQEVISGDVMASHIQAYLKQTVPATVPTPSTPPPTPEVSAHAIPPRVEKLLGGVRELWSIPAMTRKLLDLLGDSNTPLERVAEEMEQDPGLVSMVLRTINSVSYGLKYKVGSARHAVTMLGFRTTKLLVTQASLLSRLGQKNADVEFDLHSFWGHSLRIAHACSLLGREKDSSAVDEFFTAGLLHDVGKLVEYQYLRVFLRQILNGVAAGSRYEEVERRVMETDHAEIGASVCERWGFPDFVVEAIRHHLTPREKIAGLKLNSRSLLVLAVCNTERRADDEETRRWCEMIQVPPQQLREVMKDAAEVAVRSVREFLS